MRHILCDRIYAFNSSLIFAGVTLFIPTSRPVDIVMAHHKVWTERDLGERRAAEKVKNHGNRLYIFRMKNILFRSNCAIVSLMTLCAAALAEHPI